MDDDRKNGVVPERDAPRPADELQLLARVAHELAASRESDQPLEAIADHLVAALGVSRCSVCRLDEDTGELVVIADRYAAGVPSESPSDSQPSSSMMDRRMTAERWPRGHRALWTRDAVIDYREVAGAPQNGAAGGDPWGQRAVLTVPLLFMGQVGGVLEVADSASERQFGDDEVRLTTTVAGLAAAFVGNTQLREQLRRQATIDELTGLLNRRAFVSRLEESLAQAERYGSTLSLLMVDVDDFAAFNNTYGRVQGDKLLQKLAVLLRGGVRGNIDLVARYGGEEFVLLLQHTAGDGAVMAADRLQESLVEQARNAAEALRSETEHYLAEGQPGDTAGMTISIGVAFYPVHGATALDLLMASDRALYAAKSRGKNRVCVYEE